jgi:hypothetical protein
MPRRVVDSLALIVSRYEVPNFAFCRDRETARMAAAEDEVAHFDAIADRRTTITASRGSTSCGASQAHSRRHADQSHVGLHATDPPQVLLHTHTHSVDSVVAAVKVMVMAAAAAAAALLLVVVASQYCRRRRRCHRRHRCRDIVAAAAAAAAAAVEVVVMYMAGCTCVHMHASM